MNPEPEPVTDVSVLARAFAAELREIADVIEEVPELMREPDPYDAAVVWLMERDSLIDQ